MSKNEFLIDIFENPEVVIKMYISEISKSKISDQKAQKMTILWTLKVGSLIIGHPVKAFLLCMNLIAIIEN